MCHYVKFFPTLLNCIWAHFRPSFLLSPTMASWPQFGCLVCLYALFTLCHKRKPGRRMRAWCLDPRLGTLLEFGHLYVSFIRVTRLHILSATTHAKDVHFDGKRKSFHTLVMKKWCFLCEKGEHAKVVIEILHDTAQTNVVFVHST